MSEIVSFPGESLMLPPPRFISSLRATKASICDVPPAVALRKTSHTRTQQTGLRYQKKLTSHLMSRADELNVRVLDSPWLAFDYLGSLRHCQPDLLLFTSSYLFICEVKLTHTSASYWQLRYLYEPVLRKIFPNFSISLVEITRSFDPSTKYPEEFLLFFEIEKVISVAPKLGVLQWKI